MQTIIIAFTLKGQSFDKIKAALVQIANEGENPRLLLHGFMPRKLVEAKGFSTEVVDALEELFPIQTNFFYNGTVMRHSMRIYGEMLSAKVYVIGPVIEGVKEEVELYQSAGLEIVYL